MKSPESAFASSPARVKRKSSPDRGSSRKDGSGRAAGEASRYSDTVTDDHWTCHGLRLDVLKASA